MRNNLFIVVVLLLFSITPVWAQSARHYKNKPGWNVPEAPCRLIVAPGGEEFFLVKIPATLPQGSVAAVQVFAGKDEGRASLVCQDTQWLTLLVNSGEIKKGQLVKLYLVPGEQLMQVTTSRVSDPAPLRLQAQRSAGMDFPANLNEVKILKTRVDGKLQTFRIPAFEALGSTFKEWFRGDWTRKNHLVELHTWLLVPEEGKYTFGLAGVAPAWLMLDNQEILTHPTNSAHDQWSSSKEIKLGAGLREVLIHTVCRDKIDTGLAWKREGEAGTVTETAMITGGNLLEGRWEWADQTLHPYATSTAGKAYSFTGTSGYFVPFTLHNRSSSWGSEHTARWYLDDQLLGEGDTIEVVLPDQQLPCTVRLSVTLEDGTEKTCETTLTYDGTLWSEFQLTTALTGVPAATYPNESITPIISLRTTADDSLSYNLETITYFKSGKSQSKTEPLQVKRGLQRIFTAAQLTGDIEKICWSLKHFNKELSKGTLRIEREPFINLPDKVAGELLKQGDDYLVFEVLQASRSLTRTSGTSSDNTRLLILDGFLGGASLTTNNLQPEWQWVDLGEMAQKAELGGVPGLLPLASLTQLLPAPVILYAPLLQEVTPDNLSTVFERRLAAMTGLLANSAHSVRVLLVIPPASLSSATHWQGDENLLAQTMVKVADAYGVETIDLFTAFQTAANANALLKDMQLTPAGYKLVITLIKRKLYQAP